jgi:phosphatidylserine/phosphatidylglycerophosphate/cardiolipin synthase-like enzyme
MRSGKAKFRRAARFLWRPAVLAVTIIACSYGLTRLVVPTEQEGPKSPGPGSETVVESPLSATLHFNNEVGRKGALDLIRKKIEGASTSIEIAVFSLTSTELRDALYAASKRGVKITLILDLSLSGQHDALLSRMPIGMERVNAGTYDEKNSLNTAYMHHKFIIADRGRPTETLVTGSLNFTPLGEKYNQSFMFETSDHAIITAYGEEFDRLKRGVSGTKKLHDESYDPWASMIRYPDGFLEIRLSPESSGQSFKAEIKRLIQASTKSIDIIMWTLTDREIAQALVQKAKEGVMVRIITEEKTSVTAHSMIPTMQAEREENNLGTLEILIDTKLAQGAVSAMPEGLDPYIHHHLMIADGETLVTGSGNWSLWGFSRNDENHIITDIPFLVRGFQATFDHFHEKLK